VSAAGKFETPRRKQLRLRGYDYSQPGRYFVTICTYEMACIFGEIHFGQLEPTAAGRIARECWYELPSHYAGVHLDEFTVMPNHVHGIVIFEKPVGAKLRYGIAIPHSRSLPEIIRAYKSFSARRMNEITGATGKPIWKRGYFEHIVRSDKGLAAIRQYILDNPGAWEKDPKKYTFPRIGRVLDPPLRMPHFE
jgi:putative transposase